MKTENVTKEKSKSLGHLKLKVTCFYEELMLGSLKRDMGNFEKPEEEEMAQKVIGIAKLVSTEKKIREKRQKQETQRSQDMLNNLLQYSILMSAGGMYK